ncbi:phosphomannomutase/phosphoglucomutase [Oceanispirochaeta crateris]|uniref:Phosphomannomutase/phosphoglucomutase n=1 Tax=Oceanispirochaeta crateris TaxID=2518645 RepID=A0A5C1QN02_9SPIO|nr:phosphomannomutase/phosphoglucomutase [Oceanispirochaeta crateris]QEN09363.1 phosphomannomutase/phosphoglucomutase [Oceanispirochaeta crateris]
MSQEGHILSRKIIKSCDIRGIIDENLNSMDAFYIGRSFASLLKEKHQHKCVVGRDGRLSSKDFSKQLIKGLTDSGIHVIDIGLVPVGIVYFSLSFLDISAAVMVTASHNPAEYNGFKFISNKQPFHGDDLIQLESICREGAFIDGQGRLETQDVRAAYVSSLHALLDKTEHSGLKVVWDPGNGAVFSVITPFTEGLPGRHVLICAEVDGRFPHHHPDPSVEKNVRMLKDAVLDQGADLGLSFDGDGDRLAVVDGLGRLYYGDQLLVLLAQKLLEKHPMAVIMSEVKASRFFVDEIERLGGRALLWKVGHTNQKEKMQEMGILLAGETSGHFYFKENGNYDDALFTAVKVLQILYSDPDALLNLDQRIPIYYDSAEIRVKLQDKKPDMILNGIKRYLERTESEFLDVDGIRKESSHGFWIIRKSNTEPHLTVRCEDQSKEGYEESLRLIKKLLLEAGLQFNP